MYAASIAPGLRRRRDERQPDGGEVAVSGKTRLAYLTVALLLVSGILLSARSGDWSWFSRAGSAVVVIGILLTSSQIRDHSHRLRRLRSQLAAQSQRDWAVDENKRSLVRAATEQEAIWEIEGHGLYMLITGTLIWGFGDLLGQWIG